MLRGIICAAVLSSLLPARVWGGGEPLNLKGVMSLDGAWTLTLDPDGRGREWRWGEITPPLPGRTLQVGVPSVWERYLPDYHGPAAWYATSFTAPRKNAPRTVINFAAANYRTEAWLNGQYLGSHEGGYTPFSFDATAGIRPGASNRLVVLVTHPAVTGSPLKDAELARLPVAKETWYYPYAGIWGPVTLEGRSDPWIDDVTVIPNAKLDGIRVRAVIAGGGKPFRGTLVLGVGEKRERLKVALAGGPTETQGTVVEGSIRMPGGKKWTVEKPHLYRLTATLVRGTEPLETRVVTFGLRTVDFSGGVFRLNGSPLKIRGVLLQPNYPVGLVGAPDGNMAIRDLELAKSMGFNLVRSHLKPLSARQLAWCDAHGLMVYEETPLAWMDEPDQALAFQVAAREAKEMVLAHRNRASIVMWGVSNENGRFAGRMGAKVLRLVSQLDQTRPVIDVSGWAMNIFPDGGWRHETQVLNPGAENPVPLEDNHHYLKSPGGAVEWDLFRHLGTPALMGSYEAAGYGPAGEEKAWHERLSGNTDGIFVSEFGCGGLPDLGGVVREFGEFRLRESGPATATGLQDERYYAGILRDLDTGLEKRGLTGDFSGATGFIEACQLQQALGVRRQAEALRLNPRVSGWIVTQLNDVSWECSAGMVDPWRNPKRVAAEIPRLTAPYLLAARPASWAVQTGGRAEITLSLASDKPVPHEAVVEYRLAGDSPTRWTRATLRGGEETVVLDSLPARGPAFFEARLRHRKKSLAEAAETVWVDDFRGGSQVSFALWGDAPSIRAAFGSWIIPPEYARTAVVSGPQTLDAKTLAKALDFAARGGKLVFLDLVPADLAALAKVKGFPLKGEAMKSISTFLGWFHWFRRIRVFHGLPGIGDRMPATRLAGEPLADIMPVWSLREQPGSSTVYAGVVGMNLTIGDPEGTSWKWGADIMEVGHGKGRLLFCQYRLRGALESSPVARSFFYRLLVL